MSLESTVSLRGPVSHHLSQSWRRPSHETSSHDSMLPPYVAGARTHKNWQGWKWHGMAWLHQDWELQTEMTLSAVTSITEKMSRQHDLHYDSNSQAYIRFLFLHCRLGLEWTFKNIQDNRWSDCKCKLVLKFYISHQLLGRSMMKTTWDHLQRQSNYTPGFHAGTEREGWPAPDWPHQMPLQKLLTHWVEIACEIKRRAVRAKMELYFMKQQVYSAEWTYHCEMCE